MHPAAFAAHFDWQSGTLQGDTVQRSEKRLGQMRGLFLHGSASDAPDETLLYTVQWVAPAAAVAEGSLLFGCTHLQPGKIRGEYFMTHGHFHALPSRAEFYLPVSGFGLLLLMARDGTTWTEEMVPGKLVHINGANAHRAVNTGDEPLVFWACWPGDAGYDYATIAAGGFGLRVVEQHGAPALVKNEQ